MNELLDFLRSTGIANIDWRNGIMMLLALAFIYLAIRSDMEPYELLPIGLGIIIANLPLTGLTNFVQDSTTFQESGVFGIIFHFGLSFWNFLPPIIFLGL